MAATASTTAGKDVITGKLTEGKAVLAKETAVLEAVSGKKLVPVAQAVTSKLGVVSFTVKPKATTTYDLVFKGTAKLAASDSHTVTVKVTKPGKGGGKHHTGGKHHG